MMKELCIQLFEALNLKISGYGTNEATNERWIESCFISAEMTWMELKERMKGYSFNNKEEEIWFFKTMKPQFTGLIEFFTLLYRVELFVPQGKTAAIQFWQQELERVRDFFNKHAVFYVYYRTGETHQDSRYFLQAACKGREKKVARLYDGDSRLLTSKDHLVASIMAREKFRQFILLRLKETKKS